MSHPLEQRIGQVRRRVRALLLLYAAAWTLTAVLGTVLVLGAVDFLVRFADPGLRALATLSVLGVAGWMVVRMLIPNIVARFSDVQLAQRLERRFPGLNDRLASTVQFLHEPEDDPQAGSSALRRAVITQTSAEIETLDLASAVETRPAKRAALASLAVCAVAALLAVLSPGMTRIALSRLVNPLGGDQWPKHNHLAFKETIDRIAHGQPLELAVIDSQGAPLPAAAIVRLRFEGDDGQAIEEKVNLQFVDGAYLFRQDSVTRPFAYKAEGGDDVTMPWTQLEVVEPPLVETLSLTLHPPAYAGWPVEKSDPHFRALKGTRVEIAGTATKQLSAAGLRLENNAEIPAAVVADGLGFKIPGPDGPQFTVEQTGSYSFRLADHEGFSGGQQTRYEVRAVADQPPTVALEQVSSSLFVTADAEVPLTIVAKDDLAVRDVGLAYLRSDASDEGDKIVKLFDGPAQVDPAVALAQRDKGEIRRVVHRWDLKPLGLRPGVQITFHAAASDYQPAVGQSPPYRLSIITAEELADRIAQRQTFILGELSRVLKMQQEARGQVSSLEIQMQNVGRLNKPDIDHLQGAELTQRQVQRSLADRGEGVPGHIEGLLEDLKNNRVDSPEVERRMKSLLTEIDRLDKEHLGAIGREMTAALKGAQSSLPADGEGSPQPSAKDAQQQAGVEKSLAAAGDQQDQVIKSLESLLGDLSQWDNYRRFHRDITQLRHEQEDAAKQTAEVGKQTLGKEQKDLTPQQQADLKKISQRQQELARRLDKVQQQMDGMREQLDKTDPLAAGVIEDALHQSRQQGLSGQMREAAKNAEANQVSQAAQRQQEATQGLQELLDILSNKSEHELNRLVQKLKESEKELAELLAKQQGLRKKLAEAAKNPNQEERRQELERLSREQKQLEEGSQRLARKLQRLQADQAGRAAAKAGGKMAKGGQQGEEGDSQGAQDSAAAAEKDLDEAQRELAEARRQAERDLADEQLAKIEDGLKSLHAQQQEVIAETLRLEQIRVKEGRWTRGQSLSVRDLARQQQALGEETQGLAKKLAAAEVFSLALKGAAREVARAGELLEARETGAPAQTAENNALRRLLLLLTSLQPDKPAPGDKPEEKQGDQQGGESQQQQPPGDGIPSLAQLKMLKFMQIEINERTKAIETALDRAKQLAPAEQQEYDALSAEQASLADLILNLSKPDEEKKEDDPEKLPELNLDEPRK